MLIFRIKYNCRSLQPADGNVLLEDGAGEMTEETYAKNQNRPYGRFALSLFDNLSGPGQRLLSWRMRSRVLGFAVDLFRHSGIGLCPVRRILRSKCLRPTFLYVLRIASGILSANLLYDAQRCSGTAPNTVITGPSTHGRRPVVPLLLQEPERILSRCHGMPSRVEESGAAG